MHEEGWKIEGWAGGKPAFIDPRGQVHLNQRPAPPRLAVDPVLSLIEDNGIQPDYLTAGARWKREADTPEGVYLRAREAID